MNSLGIFYRYEMRKILSRKLVWITAVIVLLAVSVAVSAPLFGRYYVDGVEKDTHYNMFKTDAAYQRALTGRSVDQSLLQETLEGYGKIPKDAVRYITTEEYLQYARPYSAVFNFVRNVTGMNYADMLSWQPDEQDFYAMRQKSLEEGWKYYRLSEREKEYWREKEASLEKPFVFAYSEGYLQMHSVFNTIGLITLLSVAICLANVFPEEHIRRTDQLILSCRNGKRLYWAKLLAGITIAGGTALLYSAFGLGMSLLLYGADGFGAAFQLFYADTSSSLSVGGAMLVSYGILMVTAVFIGIFVMVLSELCRNNIATLGVVSGMIIFSMFILIPANERILAQIWGYFPSVLLSTWELFDVRLIPFFNGFLTKWQFAPLLYTILGALLTIPGKRAYQVST